MELDGTVFVWVHSEQVPENIVKLSLTVFMKNLNHEFSQVIFVEESLRPSVIPIEIHPELSPDEMDELPLL